MTALPLRCPTCDTRYDGDASFCALDGSKLAASGDGEDDLIGKVLADRYRIVKLIGQGGMGKVYESRHVNINRQFAIKVLRAEVTALPSTVARFRQEARSASSIGHENIIQIEDFATLPDGTVYLAMELLDGEPLDARMGRTPPLPLTQGLDIAVQVGNGLAAAHEKGIIHRDLKPANVFLSKRAGAHVGPAGVVVKILDFGIAKVSGVDGAPALTQTGAIFGTPLYMSPEQAMGQPLDHRTDVYSMGVILYELAVGRVPFSANSAVQVLSQHIAGVPVPPSEAAPERKIPAALDALILKALAKEPSARQATMAELVGELLAVDRSAASPLPTPLRTPTPTPLPVAAPVAAPVTNPALVAATAPPPTTVAAGGGRARAAIIAALILLPLLAGGVFLLFRKPAPAPIPVVAEVKANTPATPTGAAAPEPALGSFAQAANGPIDPYPADPAPAKPTHKSPHSSHAVSTKPVVADGKSTTPATPPVTKPAVHVNAPSAPGDSVSSAVEKLAHERAPGGRRMGSFYSGSATEDGQHSDWYMSLEPGRCYTYVATGDGSVKELYAYLWGPNGKRVTERQEGAPGVTLSYCAQQAGSYHFQVKVADGAGQYRAAIYVK